MKPPATVDAFLATLDPPRRDTVQALRELVPGADPAIAEGVKWNAPSFRTTEWFATTHLRTRDGVGLVLHRGARARPLPPGGLDIPDPTGALRWLAPDRAMLTVRDVDDLRAREEVLVAVVRAWVRGV